jgi:hypothetical protein
VCSIHARQWTRRGTLAAIGGLSFLSASPAAWASGSDAQAFRRIDKAMWVWKLDWDRVDELKAFVAALGISTLFVSLSQHARSRLLEDDAGLVSAISSLSDGNTVVWMLAGDPAWIDKPRDVAKPLRDLLEIQERLKLFAGLHLDVEPQAHPQWSLDQGARSQLLGKFSALLATVASRASSLPIEAAISPAIARVSLPNGENALLGIARHMSSMSIMAYRDTAAATLDWAGPTLDLLKTAGISWRMGVLVHQSTEARTSFFQTPPEQFRLEMLKLDRALLDRAGKPFYRGLVIEDYHGLRALMAPQQTGEGP